MATILDRRCVRCRELVSLGLDTRVAELEAALVRRHLDACPDCRRFAGDIRAATALVRAAALLEPERSVQLPRRDRHLRRVPVAAFAAAAAAAVSAVVVGGLNGNFALGPSASTAGQQSITDLNSMRLIRFHELRLPSSASNPPIREIEAD